MKHSQLRMSFVEIFAEDLILMQLYLHMLYLDT